MAAKTRGYNHPRGRCESSLVYCVRKIDKSNSPTRAGRSCLLLLWCRDRCMSRGALRESSQCGGCGTRWNPWERRGNTSTLDELPVWCALQHWDTRVTRGRHSMLVSSQFVPAWIPCRPAVGWRTWRTHDPFPIIPCHPVYTCFLSCWLLAGRQTPVTPPTCHTAGSKKTEPSCRRTDLLAT